MDTGLTGARPATEYQADQRDPLAILEALGVASPTLVTPVTGGWDTAIWRVSAAGGTYALRLFRAEQQKSHTREIAAMAAARAGGVPTPALVVSGVWRGRPVQLQEWRNGVTLLTLLRTRPWLAWSVGRRFGRLQAAIHAIQVPNADWSLPWIPLAGVEEAALQSALQLAARQTDALLHLDYHPMNVLCVGNRLTTVLDWTNATTGDPRADAARAVTLLRLTPDPAGVPRPLIRTLRVVIEAAWRRGYEERGDRLVGMPLFYAWAGAMMARDLAPKVGLPGLPLTEAHLARIRRWTAARKRQAGVLPEIPQVLPGS